MYAKSHERSIPAGAGEPAPTASHRLLYAVYPRGGGGTYNTPPHPARRVRVYPRGGGGTGINNPCSQAVMGLSPRGRGNQSPTRDGLHGRGSIPAGAGEPCSLPVSLAAPSRSIPAGAGEPYVHGGLLHCITVYPRGAGEPPWRCNEDHLLTVYPRGGGGTYGSSALMRVVAGLSPRGRGNHRLRHPHLHPGTVYPRGGGGTVGVPTG